MEKLSLDEAIENLHEELDYDKIHKVMVALDWKWHTAIREGRALENPFNIPSNKLLKEEAARLLTLAINDWNRNKSEYSVSCGGFSARISSAGSWKVSFEITEADNYW